MEELYKEGKIKTIGVSNFREDRLVDLIINSEIKPAVNQIEINPFMQQNSEVDTMKKYDVQMEAWAPFAEGMNEIFNNEVLTSIAKKYNKTVAQVILRWNIERDVVVIPKSVKVERMKENFNVFDFALDANDMESISKLDLGHSNIISHYNAETAKFLNEYKISD